MHMFTKALFVVLSFIHANGELVCPQVTGKIWWGGKAAKNTTPFKGKPSIVLIKQVAKEIDHCDDDVVAMQKKDMTHYKHDDIDCNFVMTHFGVLCEGRGWNNSVIGDETLVLCVTEIISRHSHTSAVYVFLKNFFVCPDAKAHLEPNYQIITLRDTNPLSKNPRSHLYNVVKTLPKYEHSESSNSYDSLVKEEESTIFG